MQADEAGRHPAVSRRVPQALRAGAARRGSRLHQSSRVPEDLLEAFKAKARLHDVRYQTQIKRLMTEWVAVHSTDAEYRARVGLLTTVEA